MLINRRYRLLEKLGEGGMGTVYRAEDRLTGKIVALKHVTSDELKTASHYEEKTIALLIALSHEFKTLASLRHPHIVRVLDYGFDAEKRPYFTMEYIEEA